MTYTRLPYDDAATTSEMAQDCLAVGNNLSAAHSRPTQTREVPLFSGGAAPHDEIEVSDSLAELAAGLHLHFD